MRMRLTKSKSVSDFRPQDVAMGRHRLPRDVDRGAPIETSLSSTHSDDDANEREIDEQWGSAHGEQSCDLDNAQDDGTASAPRATLRSHAACVIAFGVLPALLVILGGSAGYLTWKTVSAHFLQQARVDSVRAAADGAAAMLSYHADNVDSELRAARERLTGKFKVSYTAYTHDVVIPDSHRKHISAAATVPSAASVWATTNQAVVMLFVDQTFNSDMTAASGTASSVRVTLDKVGGRWLISDFTPV